MMTEDQIKNSIDEQPAARNTDIEHLPRVGEEVTPKPHLQHHQEVLSTNHIMGLVQAEGVPRVNNKTDNFTSNPNAADPTTLLDFYEASDEVVTVKRHDKAEQVDVDAVERAMELNIIQRPDQNVQQIRSTGVQSGAQAAHITNEKGNPKVQGAQKKCTVSKRGGVRP